MSLGRWAALTSPLIIVLTIGSLFNSLSAAPPPPGDFRKTTSAVYSLYEMIRKNDLEAIRKALDADPELATAFIQDDGRGEFHRETLLHRAASYGKLDLVKELVRRGADINARSLAWRDDEMDNSRETPLFRATSNGNEALVKFLLDRGAEINARNASGVTPLFYATRNVTVVKTLIERGAKINLQEKTGGSALRSGLWAGNRESSLFLAERGAEQDIFSAAALGNVRLLEHFLKDDPDRANARTPNGQTPLHFAAAAGELDAARLLLDRGIAITSQDGGMWNSEGDTPLHVAAHRGKLAMCKLLVDRGADIEIHGSGQSPLFESIWENRLEIAEFLLQQGADVHSRDLFTGDTPLHRAASFGHIEMAALFLRYGARINCRMMEPKRGYAIANYLPESRRGWRPTPMDCAVNGGKFEMARFLQGHGGRISAVYPDSLQRFQQAQASSLAEK